MSNMIILCKLTFVIPRLPFIFRMGKAVSSTIELVISATTDSVKSFNFAMWAFACKCFPIELVPCSDGWRRTWWQTIHVMAGLPVSSILQCKQNHHEGAWLQSFQAIGRFESTFVEGHQASNMFWKVRSLKPWIKTRLFWEVIITSSDEVFNIFESDMAVGIGKLGNPTRKTAEGNDPVQQTAGSSILTPHLQTKKSDLWDVACIFVGLNTRAYWKDWPHKSQFSNNTMQFLAVWITEPPQKALTFGGHSIVGGGCDIVSIIFACKGTCSVEFGMTSFYSR